jgi:regulatory protein
VTDDRTAGAGSRPGGRPRRESYADRRARRAAIDDPEIVLAAGLRFLETRARSVAEVRRRLIEAGYRPDLVEGTIERLTTIGLLDDDTFARHWIESRDRSRPRGEVALKRELRLRGVDAAVISAALEGRGSPDDAAPFGWRSPDDEDDESEAAITRTDPDEIAARQLLARRRRDLERVADPRKRRAKAYALLARNGFSPSIAASLSATVVAGPDADEEPGLEDSDPG